MLRPSALLRLADRGNFSLLLAELTEHCYPLSITARLQLADSTAVQIASLGLALRRACELAYGVTDAAEALAETLRRCLTSCGPRLVEQYPLAATIAAVGLDSYAQSFSRQMETPPAATTVVLDSLIARLGRLAESGSLASEPQMVCNQSPTLAARLVSVRHPARSLQAA